MGFDFSGCDMICVNETLIEFEALCELYPEVARQQLKGITSYKKLKPPRSWHRRWSPNVYAHASKDGWIGLNPNVYKKAQPFIESLESDHTLSTWGANKGIAWHPAGVKLKGQKLIRSVMTHEFGHQVDNFLGRALADVAVTEVAYADGSGLMVELYKGILRNEVMFQRSARKLFVGRDLARDVSRYACKNSAERFAEAFTQLRWGNAQVRGRSWTKALGNFLDFAFAGLRGEAGSFYMKDSWVWSLDARRLFPSTYREMFDRSTQRWDEIVTQIFGVK